MIAYAQNDQSRAKMYVTSNCTIIGSEHSFSEEVGENGDQSLP